MFTHGHWVNNRSLFPSQDVPEALATWSAFITVADDMMVLMSGDYNPDVIDCGDSEYTIYRFHNRLLGHFLLAGTKHKENGLNWNL